MSDRADCTCTEEEREIAEALHLVRIHCLPEGATPADAMRFCILHTAVTLQRLIAEQEREGMTAH